MRYTAVPHPGAHRTRAPATTPNSRPRHPRRIAQEAEVEVEAEVEEMAVAVAVAVAEAEVVKELLIYLMEPQ